MTLHQFPHNLVSFNNKSPSKYRRAAGWLRRFRRTSAGVLRRRRHRFVLSVGHAFMRFYAMLHLTGTKAVNPKYETLGRLLVTLEDLKHFRWFDSTCPTTQTSVGRRGSKRPRAPWARDWRRASGRPLPNAGRQLILSSRIRLVRL